MLCIHSACMPFPMLGCNIGGYDQSYAYDDDKAMSFVLTQRCTEVTILCINFVHVSTIHTHVFRNDLNGNDLNKKET